MCARAILPVMVGSSLGAGRVLVTEIDGYPVEVSGNYHTIVLVAEGRGSKLRVSDGATATEVRDAAKALAERLVLRQHRGRTRDLIVETVNGERAAGSRWADALRDAGFKGMGTGLRYYSGP